MIYKSKGESLYEAGTEYCAGADAVDTDNPESENTSDEYPGAHGLRSGDINGEPRIGGGVLRCIRGQSQMGWLENSDPQQHWQKQQGNEPDARDYAAETQAESLKDYVRSQLPAQSGKLAHALSYLTECLDENGWLLASLEVLAAESGLSLALLERALSQIQNVEPWGVGARDLRECLLIQLFHRPNTDDIAAKIVRDHLPELAKNQYNSIAKALRISQERVRRAVEQIRSLNPRPGNGFACSEPTTYIIPDMIAEWNGNSFDILLSRSSLPQLNISNYYVQLRRESSDPEVTAYLDSKVRQAKWVIAAVDQRKETMLRCMQAIMTLQPEYFRHAQGALRPMTLADVAAKRGYTNPQSVVPFGASTFNVQTASFRSPFSSPGQHFKATPREMPYPLKTSNAVCAHFYFRRIRISPIPTRSWLTCWRKATVPSPGGLLQNTAVN